MDEREELPNAVDLEVIEVMNFAPHCVYCFEEIIADEHVLQAVEEDGGRKGYVPCCMECLAEYIKGENDDEGQIEEDWQA